MTKTTEMTTYTCRCGDLDGAEHCEWTGDLADLVLVEYMPEQHRASHTAAGNSGCWPANGAIRAALHWECAERIIDAHAERDLSEWIEDLGRPDNLADYAEEVAPSIDYAYVRYGEERHGAWTGDRDDAIQAAADELDATDEGDGKWSYYADEISERVTVSADALAHLGAGLMAGRPLDDLYSLWCQTYSDYDEVD